MNVSVMEGSLKDRIRFVWTIPMTGCIFYVDFLKNRIVGFDENATEDWRKDRHQSAQFLLLNLNCDFAERDGIVRALALGKQ